MLILQAAPPAPEAAISVAHAPGQPQATVRDASGQILLSGEAAFVVALRTLISRGFYAEADRLLRSAPSDLRRIPDVMYLEAQLQRRRGRRLAAVDLYNRLLSAAPNSQLIRLELAQTYFEIGDDRAAEQWFLLALSGALPQSDASHVHAYLEAIRKRGGWRISTALSVAPDSNYNAATSAAAVTIFGAPFSLNDRARAQSGVGETVSVLAERSSDIVGPLRADVQAYGSVVDNPGTAFDQIVFGARAGPQLVQGERVVSLLAGFEQFHYGGPILYEAHSLSLRAEAPTNTKTLYSTSLSAQRLNYPHLPDYTAWNGAFGVQRTRYLDPQSFWRLSFRAGYNQAAASFQSYRAGTLAAGYYHVLPLGLAVYTEVGLGVTDYVAPLPFFGVRRRDVTESLGLQLAFRARTFAGFAPYIGLLSQSTQSDVALYKLARTRLEIGVARAF